MMQSICVRTALTLCAIAASSPSQATITFQFNYLDSGVGFNDPTFGAQRKAALEEAAGYYASAFSTYNATLSFDVMGTDTGNTLASAGSNFGSYVEGFGGAEVIRNKVLNGTDLNGSAADGTVNANFTDQVWEFDVNTAPTSPEYDWYSTIFHEFAHAFGFASGIVTDGTVSGTDDGYGSLGNGSWAAFDEFLTDKDGNSVFSGNDLNEANYVDLLTGGASPGAGLFFNSADAGQLIGLYSPTSFEEGSSGSHLDDENAALAGMMMLSATDDGLGTRVFSDLELSIFRDLGYASVSQIVIPEPTSLLFIVAGFGFVATRRSQQL